MEIRIDELALRTGTTSRNIRAYQQRGLLPPPRLRGRTGFYSEEHLHRVELIRDLQQRGFSLEAIRQTLDAWSKGGDINDLLGFHQILTQPWTDDPGVELTVERLRELFPEAVGHPEVITQAVERGLLTAAPDGRFRAPEVLIEAGAQLARAGIPMTEIFALVETLRAHAAEIAQRFVELVAGRLVEPIAEGNASPEEIHRVTESVLGLRAVALEVFRPFLAQELHAATERALQDFRRRTEDAEAAGNA